MFVFDEAPLHPHKHKEKSPTHKRTSPGSRPRGRPGPSTRASPRWWRTPCRRRPGCMQRRDTQKESERRGQVFPPPPSVSVLCADKKCWPSACARAHRSLSLSLPLLSSLFLTVAAVGALAATADMVDAGRAAGAELRKGRERGGGRGAVRRRWAMQGGGGREGGARTRLPAPPAVGAQSRRPCTPQQRLQSERKACPLRPRCVGGQRKHGRAPAQPRKHSLRPLALLTRARSVEWGARVLAPLAWGPGRPGATGALGCAGPSHTQTLRVCHPPLARASRPGGRAWSPDTSGRARSAPPAPSRGRRPGFGGDSHTEPPSNT